MDGFERRPLAPRSPSKRHP